MLYETRFLIALFLTLIIEVPILFAVVKYVFKEKIKKSKILFVGFLASFSTIPYLWFVFPHYINGAYYIYIGEIVVFFVEALIYQQLFNLKPQKALLVSFATNLASFGFGLIIF